MTARSALTHEPAGTRQGTAVVKPGEHPAAEGAGAGGVSPSIWLALQEAAVVAGAELEAAADGGWPAAELRAHAMMLCAITQEVVAGEPMRLNDLSPAIPMRRLADSVRRHFIAGVRADRAALDPAHAIHVLDVLEGIQQSLEADAAHRFASRLGGLDAVELIVDVAHDMRSPLGSILFLAERLRKAQSGPVNALQERQLGLVYSAAFGLSSLASDVIELAKGGDRLVDLHPMPFSVSEIMQSVRDIVQPIAEEKGLTMRFVPPDGGARVGYPAALNRVLLNLTTNALKFTAEGGVEVTARPLSRTRVEFSVRDSGRGIPPQVMGTLFDAFRRRLKPGEYVFSSAGLGLSICQKLVAAMKGELKVETATEMGTRFYFEVDLPLVSKM